MTNELGPSCTTAGAHVVFVVSCAGFASFAHEPTWGSALQSDVQCCRSVDWMTGTCANPHPVPMSAFVEKP